MERREGKSRFWCAAAGCSAMVASMCLLGAIFEAQQTNPVRLFEAFISFKDAAIQSNSKGVAKVLRNVVRGQYPCRKMSSPELKSRPDDELLSAFCVLDSDCGVPAVIVL